MANSSPSDLVSYIFGDPIPAPEVIDSDPTAAWSLWEEAVRQLDALLAVRDAPAGPGVLVGHQG